MANEETESALAGRRRLNTGFRIAAGIIYGEPHAVTKFNLLRDVAKNSQGDQGKRAKEYLEAVSAWFDGEHLGF